MTMRDPLDGNAAAGELSAVFGVDVTAALATCASCQDRRAVAELVAYLHAAGLVLRCPSCEAVELRFVRAGSRGWLDARGVRVLEVTVPTGS
jgi:hypothetical protein